MAIQLADITQNISFGPSISHQRLRITPLYSAKRSALDYLLFEDSIVGEFVEVVEVSKSGSVPELLVRNRAETRVLLPDGTTLIGSKQNRVVNVSILLAPKTETVIPVSCVERGRWSFAAPRSSPSEHVDKELRRAMCADATAALERDGKVQVSQSGVWCHVEGMLQGSGAYSPSHAYHAVHEKWNNELADYQERLPWPDGSAGVAVELDGRVETIELFDKPDTLRRLWPRLIRSYAIGALANPVTAKGLSEPDIASFLSRSVQAEVVHCTSVGAGTWIRLSSDDSVGAAVVCDDQLVHLALFASRSRNHPRPTRPNETRSQGATAPDQQAEDPQYRPWWRFWM